LDLCILSLLSAVPPPPPQQQQKHDIFVGNLAFNTTEEQLHQAFSEIGKVIKVRLVTDVETGKPRGFAFVEFEDPQVALAAIRNMNDYELNGRRIRVNFSSSSHLEVSEI
jgi:cleavage stimulation factor subunit 2